jgi:hypothetical protein
VDCAAVKVACDLKFISWFQECVQGTDVNSVGDKRVLRVIKILRILKIMRLLKGFKLVE